MIYHIQGGSRIVPILCSQGIVLLRNHTERKLALNTSPKTILYWGIHPLHVMTSSLGTICYHHQKVSTRIHSKNVHENAPKKKNSHRQKQEFTVHENSPSHLKSNTTGDRTCNNSKAIWISQGTNYCLWTELYSELIPNGGLALAILVLWYK